MNGLRRRGMELRMASTAAGAMVELAQGRPAALIVVEPNHWPQYEELLRATMAHFTRTSVWSYRGAGKGAGKKGEGRLERARAQAPGEAAGVPESALAGTNMEGVNGEASQAASAGMGAVKRALDEPLLTEDEIAMLIGTPFEEPTAESTKQAQG